MPPTKPTLPVLLASAAIMPTRKLPSCSLKTIDSTFGCLTTESMIAKLSFGNSLATFSRLRALREADADDRVGAALGHAAHAPARAAPRWLISKSRYGLPDLLLPALGAVVGGLVERLVELAAHVVDDGGLGQRARRRPQASDDRADVSDLHGMPLAVGRRAQDSARASRPRAHQGRCEHATAPQRRTGRTAPLRIGHG